MYLSCLEIDVTRRQGRMWLGNPYRVHQRLLMAYADGEAGRLLFRIEENRQPPRIIVQSPVAANWEAAFTDLPVLASPPRQKRLELSVPAGRQLLFLVRANPTMRKPVPSVDESHRLGPRLGLLREEDQREWLRRKGESGGFRPLSFDVVSRGLVRASGNGARGADQTHLCVDFQGYLLVTDADRFATTLASGVGSAKGYGYGLLSIAPA